MDWKIPKSVQEERDRKRLEILRLEQTDPAYMDARPIAQTAVSTEEDVTKKRLGDTSKESEWVTDPEILKQLNSSDDEGWVTDPALLAQLNGSDKEPGLVGFAKGAWEGTKEHVTEAGSKMTPEDASGRGAFGAAAGAAYGATVGGIAGLLGIPESLGNMALAKIYELKTGKKLSDEETRATYNSPGIVKWLDEKIRGLVNPNNEPSFNFGEAVVASPFVGLRKEAGDRWGLSGEMSFDVIMGIAGLKGLSKIGKAKELSPKAVETAPEQVKALETKPTTETPFQPELAGMDTEITPFRGGKEGGIDLSRTLSVDENGMPIDLARTADVATEMQKAADAGTGRNTAAIGDMFMEEPKPIINAFEQLKAAEESKAYGYKRSMEEALKTEQVETAWTGEVGRQALKQHLQQQKDLTAMSIAFEKAKNNPISLGRGPGAKQRGGIDITAFDEGLRALTAKFSNWSDKLGQMLPLSHKFMRNEDGTPKVLIHVSRDKFPRSALNSMNDIGIHFGDTPVPGVLRVFPDLSEHLTNRGWPVNDITKGHLTELGRNYKPVNSVRVGTTERNAYFYPKLLETNPSRIISIPKDLGYWNDPFKVSRALGKSGHLSQEQVNMWDSREIYNRYGAEGSGFPYTERILRDFRKFLVEEAGIDVIKYPNEYEKLGGTPTSSYLVLNVEKLKDAGDVSTTIHRSGPRNQRGSIDPSVFGLDKVGELSKNLFSRMRMPAKEFIEFFNKFEAKNKEDLPWSQIGLSTSSWRAFNTLISHPEKAAAWALKYIDDQIHLLSELEHARNEQGKKVWEDYATHYNLNFGKVATGQFSPEKFRNDITIALKMEADNSTWFNGRDYIPTFQQLVDHGMTPESAKVWRAVHQVMGVTWKTLEDTATLNGRILPPRIPGYLPHVVKGPFKVQVFRNFTDPQTGQVKRILDWNSGHWSRKEAKKFYDAISQNLDSELFEGRHIEIVEPKKGLNTASQLIEGLFEAKEITNNPGLSALLQRIYESAAQGIVTHALDRKTIPVAGHFLERATMTGDLQLSPKRMREAANQLQMMTQAVNGWYTRSKFVNEILFPLDAAGIFKDRVNLRDTVKGFMDAFFQIGELGEHRFEAKVRDFISHMGKDPKLANSVVTTLQSGFAKYYLLGKWQFYFTNYLQQAVAFPMLQQVKAIGESMGEKTGSVSKAIAEAFPDQVTHTVRHPNILNNQLWQYAQKNGHVKPTFMEAADPSRMVDPIAVSTETITRGNSFVLGYHYFKQIMAHEDALKAAGRFSDMVAVPYDKAVGAPVLLSKTGMLGNMLSMFMTYGQHQLGMMSNQVRTMGLAAKMKNPKAFVEAMSAAASLQALNMALYGIGGIAFASNYESLVNYFNQMYGTQEGGTILPSLKAWMKDLTDGQDEWVQNTAMFGVPSTALNFDFSGSGSGAGINAPTASWNAAEFGGLGIYLALSNMINPVDKKPTNKDWHNWIKRSSPQWKPHLEAFILDKPVYSNALKGLMNKPTNDFMPMPQDPNVPLEARNPEDSIAHLFGRTPRESKAYIDLATYKRLKDADNLDVSRMVQILKEGNLPEKILWEVASKLVSKHYKDPDALVQELKNYEMEKSLTMSNRTAKAATSNSSSAKKWYLEWQKIHGGK